MRLAATRDDRFVLVNSFAEGNPALRQRIVPVFGQTRLSEHSSPRPAAAQLVALV